MHHAHISIHPALSAFCFVTITSLSHRLSPVYLRSRTQRPLRLGTYQTSSRRERRCLVFHSYSPEREQGFNQYQTYSTTDSVDYSDSEEYSDASPLGSTRKVVKLAALSSDDLTALWLRLCENDIDYNDMKHMCKDNELGGKDLKYNLRAKLIREIRRLLGMTLWDRFSYGRNPKTPAQMTEKELKKFYKEREIMFPEDREEAIGLAYAIMVVDGVLKQSEVPSQSKYDRMNTDDLKRECKSRGLKAAGNKTELVEVLKEDDKKKERIQLEQLATTAANRELQNASIYVHPRPPNRVLAQKLKEAQVMIGKAEGMSLPMLREVLFARGLPVYGTREVLQGRLLEVLRRDVINAHAGNLRLVRYAEEAVKKLSDTEVAEALADRGQASYGLGEEAAARLANELVAEWINRAMYPMELSPDVREEDGSGEEYVDGGGVEDVVDSAAAYGGMEEEEEEEHSREQIDPTYQVLLVASGNTPDQRDDALAAVRATLPSLQTDRVYGTLLPATATDPALEEALAAAAATTGVMDSAPEESVEIAFITPVHNGVVVTVDALSPPPGCSIVVEASPEASENGQTGGTCVTAESRFSDIFLKGLVPGSIYAFTAKFRNSAGDGPAGEPYITGSVLRQGLMAKVLYPVPNLSLFAHLTWEAVHGSSALELDVLLAAGGYKEAKTLEQWTQDNGEGTVVMALGPPMVEQGGVDDGSVAVVGSWASQGMYCFVFFMGDFHTAYDHHLTS